VTVRARGPLQDDDKKLCAYTDCLRQRAVRCAKDSVAQARAACTVRTLMSIWFGTLPVTWRAPRRGRAVSQGHALRLKTCRKRMCSTRVEFLG